MAAGLEGDDVVVHPEGLGQRPVAAGDGRDTEVGGAHALSGDDRDDRGRAVDHAHLALGELGPQVGAVGGAGAGLGVAGRRERLQPVHRVGVLRAVDDVLPRGVDESAAVAEEPQQGLGLRLLGAERETEADLAGLGLDRGGVALQLRPGPRG